MNTQWLSGAAQEREFKMSTKHLWDSNWQQRECMQLGICTYLWQQLQTELL